MKTPEKTEPDKPYYESPTGTKELPETPGYKGQAVGVGTRQSLPRAAKRVMIVDFLTSPGRQRDDGVGGSSDGLQDVFLDENFGESEGEGRSWKRKRKTAGV